MKERMIKRFGTAVVVALLIVSVLLTATPTAVTASPTVSAVSTPSSGPVGTTVNVTGTGAAALDTIKAYWDGMVELSTEPAIVKANATGAYTFNFTVLEDVAGRHYILVENGSGPFDLAAFDIEPEIVLEPRVGLKDDIIVVNGTGFAAYSVVTMSFNDTYVNFELTTTPSTVETGFFGSFSGVTFDVPVAEYGDYRVYATDDEGNQAEADFTVGPVIAVTPEEGPSGTVVDVSGRGFEKHAGRMIKVYIDGEEVPLVDDIETTSGGTFTGEFIVPTLDLGEYIVKANQTTGASGWIGAEATADFEVTGTTGITLTPESGALGMEVTVEGVNFTAIEDTEVEVKLATVVRATLSTNETGGFKGTFTVPSLPPGDYTVMATDEYGLFAEAEFEIYSALIASDPVKGPTGTNVTVTAYGLTPGKVANVTFGGIVVLMGEPVDDLAEGESFFFVPTVPVGVYTMTVEDEEGLSASRTFKVTATTRLTVDPDEAAVGSEITITGEGFSPNSVVEIVLYNATYDAEVLNDTQSVKTDSDGEFEFEWTVPTDLAPGDYWLNATDVERTFPPDDENLIRVVGVSFEVFVIEPTVTTISEAISDIREKVDHHGIAKSLTSKLRNALRALDRGNTEAFRNMLNAFMNHVRAQSGKKIDGDYAATLMEWARAWMQDPELAR